MQGLKEELLKSSHWWQRKKLERGVTDGWREWEVWRKDSISSHQCQNMVYWLQRDKTRLSFWRTHAHTHARTHTHPQHRMASSRSIGHWRLLCEGALKTLANKPYGWQTAVYLSESVCVCVCECVCCVDTGRLLRLKLLHTVSCHYSGGLLIVWACR